MQTKPAKLCWKTRVLPEPRGLTGRPQRRHLEGCLGCRGCDTGVTLGMAVALRDSLCLGPQIQVTDIERNLARVGAGDVPENTVETLLAPVLLASIVSASVALVGLGGDIAGDFLAQLHRRSQPRWR